MAARIFFFVLSGTVIQTLIGGTCVLAAPDGVVMNITPSLATAKTIQVNEIVFEAQNGAVPGPLRRARTMSFRIERPNKFRVDWQENDPAKPASYYVSDGKMMIAYDGRQFHSQPTAHAEWPFPIMGLLNNTPGQVTVTPSIREGKRVLLAVRPSPSGRSEYWFDPGTHLLIRDMMFMTWQGKTTEVMRTEYMGWLLNKPIPVSLFRLPPAGMKHTGSGHSNPLP